MRRVTIVGLLLLAGCAWSNSLYQARALSKSAAQAERENRPADARQLWGQVVVKGDSAYARAPQGTRGAEALWLAGHAAAKTNDCPRAIPRLQGAMSAGPYAAWRQQLLFELALCEEPLGGPTAASLYTTLIASSSDPDILRRARLRLGHSLVLREAWPDALTALGNDDTLPARLDRAMALAALGRGNSALAELALPLARADTSVRWLGFIEMLAARDTPAADSLLNRVLAFRNVPSEQQSRWLLAGARAALTTDPAATDRRLRQLLTQPPGFSVSDGRVLQGQLSLLRAATVPALRVAVDSLATGDLSDAGATARALGDQLRIARELIARNDAVNPGAPTGDLTMFGLAEFARDSLGSTRLAAWFFARLEQYWPRSAYLGKALMARAPLEPDSATQLLVRLRVLGASPYVSAANGELAGAIRVTQLEDSLGRFVDRMWVKRPDHQ